MDVVIVLDDLIKPSLVGSSSKKVGAGIGWVWIIQFFTFCGAQLPVVSFNRLSKVRPLTSHVEGEKPGCVARETSSYYPRISSLVKIFIQALFHFFCLDAAVAAHVIITQFPLRSQKSWKYFKVTSKRRAHMDQVKWKVSKQKGGKINLELRGRWE